MIKSRLAFGAVLCAILLSTLSVYADPPASYDLRDVLGVNYVTSVKSQQGGTCWTHGAMAAIEGNLLMTGVWTAVGETGEPNMAEYHLDWWNGFNQHNNDDLNPPSGAGLVVHEGGDYRVTSAYLSRGEGAVRDIDAQIYSSPPLRDDSGYHYFYVRDIEWFVAESDLSNINTIKNMIIDYGVLGTCMFYSDGFIEPVTYTHYQNPASSFDPNHAVAIVGWDDNKVTQAPNPGAWLCKNSWGDNWGLDGYFWISYYDKHSCQHPEMGAISFQGVEPMQYDKVYYHDYHGWRNTLTGCTEAFNAFVAEGDMSGTEELHAVSFFTAADSVDYVVVVLDDYISGQLLNDLAVKGGTITHTGFHTIDLDTPVELTPGDDFYIYVLLSAGGHAYDQTSDVPVLLGAKYRTIVESSADPGQSYYSNGGEWVDFYEDDTTANFCIKGLSKVIPFLGISFPDGLPDYLDPGTSNSFTVEITDGSENYLPGSGTLYYRYDGGDYQSVALTSLGGSLYEATLPSAGCDAEPEFYISIEGESRSIVRSPATAPTLVYTALVGWESISAQYNFEDNTGWTTENLGATSGNWNWGVPVNDPDWAYDPISDGDGSGRCYLTANQYGNSDVDGGAVRLTSPVFDLSGGGTISYDYYLYLTDTEGGVDRLLVEINNNGGTGMWHEIARHDTDGGTGWRHHIIYPTDLEAISLTPTATMVVRFTANDADPQSIVEAAVDNFSATYVECEVPYICGDANGDADINLLDILYLIDYLYGSPAGDPPDPMESGDANADGDCNLLDVLYLIDHLYGSPAGPAPLCP